jgi:hypothetical protein
MTGLIDPTYEVVAIQHHRGWTTQSPAINPSRNKAPTNYSPLPPKESSAQMGNGESLCGGMVFNQPPSSLETTGIPSVTQEKSIMTECVMAWPSLSTNS